MACTCAGVTESKPVKNSKALNGCFIDETGQIPEGCGFTIICVLKRDNRGTTKRGFHLIIRARNIRRKNIRISYKYLRPYKMERESTTTFFVF